MFCAGKDGKCWTIAYAVPRPKRIRYRYGSGAWQEIEGQTYTITNSGVTFPTPYGFSVLRNGWIDVDVYQFGGFTNFIRRTRFFQTGGQLNLGSNVRVVSYNIPNRGVKGIYGGNRNYPIIVNTQNLGSNTINQTIIICSGNATDGNNVLADCFLEIVNSQNQPPPSNCTFKVFNCNNVEILSITNTQCPQVEVIDCEFNPNDLKIINITPKAREILINLPGFLSRVPFMRGNQKCVKVVLLRFVANPFAERFFEILEICSPPCCDKEPFVDIQCESDCGCERCPDDYCFACLDGGEVCCYGGDGTVIKRIPLDKLCKDQKIC